MTGKKNRAIILKIHIIALRHYFNSGKVVTYEQILKILLQMPGKPVRLRSHEAFLHRQRQRL